MSAPVSSYVFDESGMTWITCDLCSGSFQRDVGLCQLCQGTKLRRVTYAELVAASSPPQAQRGDQPPPPPPPPRDDNRQGPGPSNGRGPSNGCGPTSDRGVYNRRS
ncbi:hypothetical protein ACJ41O_004966 [Fusarium nematophilum]